MFKRQVRSVITIILIVVLMIPFFTIKANAAYENTYTNTGNMRDDIIGVALTQVGYTEGDNNYTKYGVWYGQPNSPWCGMFVSWCANQAGIPTSVLKRTGIANPSNFGLSYKSGTEYTPQKGDLFFKKNFSHVGLVYYTEGAYFYTLEGNTSTSGYDGTSVMIRKRKISDFYFSTPNYSGSGSSGGCSHNYETKVEADHPHKEFKACTKCGNKSYTGNKFTEDDCKTCIQEACSHEFNSWTKTSDSKHARVCSKCELTQTESHDWESGEVLSEATCVEEGSQKVVCQDCGTETTKAFPATGEHDYTDYSYIDEDEHQKVCSDCEKQTTSEHTLNDDWDNDSIYHWTSCSDCGGRIRHQEHSFPNGCQEACEVCGYVLDGGHIGDGIQLSDDSFHWETCLRCGFATEKVAHTFASDCDEVCDDCGYTRDVTVAHNDEIQANEAGHWNVCSACHRQSEVFDHSADENAEEWDDLLCVQCGFELRSADRHMHQYASVDHDETTHWGACPCGEIMEPEVHTWDMKTGTCSICGATNTPVKNQTFGSFLISLWNSLWK